MIPTIEQIVKDLAAGTCTQEQAIAWLNQHVKLASDTGYENGFYAARDVNDQ